MKKELIYDTIQKSGSYANIGLNTKNNRTKRYDKRYRFSNFESIRLTI